MKKEKQQEPPAKEKMQVEYRNAYLLKGNALHPFNPDYEAAAGFVKKKFSEKNFKSEKELNDLIFENRKILFGEKTIIVDIENILGLRDDHIVPAFMIDFMNPDKPMFYFIEVILSQKNLGELFYRVTRMFSVLRNAETRNKVAESVERIIGKNSKMKKELGANPAILERLKASILKSPRILLALDTEREEMKGFMETYTETWGKMIKPIIFRRFATKDETIVTAVPTFDMIRGEGKKKTDNGVPPTEEEHFDEKVSVEVKAVYEKIKSELLKKNPELEFRPQRYYISMRKNKNLAFFHIGRKKISLVVMNPEKDTRKQIKRHEIKSLTQKVQKFWNGPSCTIVLGNSKNLNEVISLLKKLVAGA